MLRKLARPAYSAPKTVSIDWNNFRGGWDNLLRQTELQSNELAQATNLMLIGLGVPTKRWGTENHFLASPTGYGRGLLSIKSSTEVSELLALTDWGYLTKKSGASYTMVTGASWASGYEMEGVQLSDTVYIVNGQRELVKYNFSTLAGFTTLAIPTGLTATNISGATGANVVSYRITALSNVGETIGSTPVSLTTLPQALSSTVIKLQWTPVSAASGLLVGYNIYRGAPGDETWLAAVDTTATQFFDFGTDASLLREPPTADTTGGPIGKYIARFQDRIIIAGIPGKPTLVYISGRVPYHERYSWSYGGGSVSISPDDGQDITGLSITGDKIIIFKEKSVYQLGLSTIDAGGFTLLEPTYTLITAGQGCTSHRSIIAVENDLFFVGIDGLYILGYEPNILNVLRTNELSAKIRPFFDSLSYEDKRRCSAEFYDRKYILTFPVSKKTIVFDRERTAFMGPWPTPFGLSRLVKYTDVNGVTYLVGIDSTDNYVTNFSANARDDKGEAILTVLKTKKEQFGAWDLFKTIDDLFMQFRNVSGSININIILEDRVGAQNTAKSFTVTGAAQLGQTGWGTDQWGTVRWGETNNDPGATAEETPIRAIISQGFRTLQLEILTSNRQDNYELLGIRTAVHAQGPGSVPYTWTV